MKIRAGIKALNIMLAGLVVLAMSQPTIASDAAKTTDHEDQIGLFVQAIQGKDELRLALARFGLYQSSFNGDESPFYEAADSVAGSYSRPITGRLEEVSPNMSVGQPQDGDELAYSWRVDELSHSRSYVFQRGKWHSSAKILKGEGALEKQASSETRVVQMSGRIGPVGNNSFFKTVELPRVIAALYLQSSTIFGVTIISGIGTNILVVNAQPSGFVGYPFSGTVTALVIYQ